jgi:hypothetical protein
MRDEPVGRELRQVRLDGSYPETVIVVSFLNLNSGVVEELRVALWNEFRLADGTMQGPDIIVRDIWTMMIEP